MPKSSDAGSPDEYIAGLDEPRRGQIARLHELIRRVVPELEPHMQSGMIGYGTYHYKYASGSEGDWFVVGLASNKRYISLLRVGYRGQRVHRRALQVKAAKGRYRQELHSLQETRRR
jgi:hypothetical protein